MMHVPGASIDMSKSKLLDKLRRDLDSIHEHKWYESEKAGCDVGYDWAIADWLCRYKSKQTTQEQKEKAE